MLKNIRVLLEKNSEECSLLKLCGMVPVHSKSLKLHSVP